ncbi:subunit length determinant protein [Humibacillus xanthopallidus]|uniref:Subunit length determinant protein n=2 Tax=Humibacillus xanthopallidus TaxID=412689 RepID=A0A543I1R1_9MICO|nr:subunit length determinant protein [Humibacillus xanthopallidus]
MTSHHQEAGHVDRRPAPREEMLSTSGTEGLHPAPLRTLGGPPPAQEHGIPGRLVLWTLRRFWWLILLTGLLFGLLAVVGLRSTNPGYESQARLLVGQLTGSTDSLRASASLGQTYADALGSEAVLRRVGAAAGLPDGSADKLLAAADVTFNDKSRILSIVTTWPDAATAHRLTGLLVEEVERLKAKGPSTPGVSDPTPDVRAQENTREASGVLTLIQAATLPDRTIETHQSAIAMLAAVAGSLVAFTLLCFSVAQRHRRCTRVRSVMAPSDYLGSVTRSRRTPARHDPPTALLGRGRRVHEYAEIAARIEVRATTFPLDSLCVVGTRGGPSAAEVAINVAAVLAMPGRPASVVDPTDSVHSIRLTRTHQSVVQVGYPQEESDIAERLMSSSGSRGEDLLVLTLPSLVSALAGPWWLSASNGVVLVGSYDDPTVERDVLDSMDAIARRGGRLIGVILLRAGRPISRLLTPPENITDA